MLQHSLKSKYLVRTWKINSPVPWGLEEFKIDLRISRMNWDWLSRNVLQICYINLQFSIFDKNLFWKAFLIELTSGPHPAVLVLFTFVCCEQTEAPQTSRPLSAHGARIQSREQLFHKLSLSFALLVNWSYWNKNNSFTKEWQPGAGQAPRWVRQDRGLAATGLNSVCCSRGKPRKLWTHADVLFFTRKPTVHCFPYYCARNSPHASRLTLNCKISQIDYVMITENPKSDILILWDKRVLVPHCTMCCLYSTIDLWLK